MSTDSNKPPTLDYATPQRRKSREKWFAAIILAFCGVVSVVILLRVILAVTDPRIMDRPVANQAVCANNLSQIGKALIMYANDNGGRLPDDFGQLLIAEDLPSKIFTCPESSDSPAYAPTTQATAAALLSGGHLSYIYQGKGQRITGPQSVDSPDVVLAYEPLSNHGNSGMNVLFGDGHVQWLTGSDAQSILNQAAANSVPIIRPPRNK